jgi:hypothetical protein
MKTLFISLAVAILMMVVAMFLMPKAKSQVQMDSIETEHFLKIGDTDKAMKIADKYFQMEIDSPEYCEYFTITERAFDKYVNQFDDETIEELCLVYENLDCHCKDLTDK